MSEKILEWDVKPPNKQIKSTICTLCSLMCFFNSGMVGCSFLHTWHLYEQWISWAFNFKDNQQYTCKLYYNNEYTVLSQYLRPILFLLCCTVEFIQTLSHMEKHSCFSGSMIFSKFVNVYLLFHYYLTIFAINTKYAYGCVYSCIHKIKKENTRTQ